MATLLTAEELCKRLRITRHTLLKLRTNTDDPLPAMKCARFYFYDWAKVMAWMERQADKEVQRLAPKRGNPRAKKTKRRTLQPRRRQRATG